MKTAMLRLPLLLLTTPLLVAQVTPAVPAAAAPEPGMPPEQIISVPEPGRFRNLFQQFRTERATLSPDGRHLAYSVREDRTASVVVIDLEHPETIKSRVELVDDDAATLRLDINQREDNPGRILWLRWTTSNRLVAETNATSLRGTGAILGFDADGGNARRLAYPGDLLPHLKLGAEFATGRTSSPLFPTPDVSASSGTEDDLGSLGFALPAQDEEMAITPMDPAEVSPRSLRVFDLDFQRPGAVTIVTRAPRENGTQWVDFLTLDSLTGKLTELTDALVMQDEAFLLDRQGRPRFTLANTTRYSFPFRYLYLGAQGRSRPVPFDEVFGAPGFSISPENFFGERAIPLGFGEDPNLLYYAANLGRDTHGIYSFNLATGKRNALVMENPAFDLVQPQGSAFPGTDALVYDRFSRQLAGVRYQGERRTTAWVRPEWQAVQAELEKAMPGHTVELIEWDEAGRKFLVGTEGPADPGAFHLYDRDQGKLLEFVRRAPWVEANHTYQTLPFGFTLADGTRLDGFITVPRQPRIKPIPMIMICPDVPWARVEPVYNREVHALAGMGFVVVQLNGRGAWGSGRRQREAITAGYDLVQVGDLVAAVDALSRRFQVNPRRVALLGRGHGGFIALRTLQEHPEKFRCAIALEPPVDLADWLAASRWTDVENVFTLLTRAWLGDEQRLRAAPLVSAPEKLTQPVLVLSHPGPDGADRRPFYLAARSFAASVNRRGGSVEFADLRTDYVQGLPGARAEVFDHIEEFLNLHIYDFKVKVHDFKVLK